MLNYTKSIAGAPSVGAFCTLELKRDMRLIIDGDDWQTLQNNLPHAPVSGIVVQEHFNDLLVAHMDVVSGSSMI